MELENIWLGWLLGDGNRTQQQRRRCGPERLGRYKPIPHDPLPGLSDALRFQRGAVPVSQAECGELLGGADPVRPADASLLHLRAVIPQPEIERRVTAPTPTTQGRYRFRLARLGHAPGYHAGIGTETGQRPGQKRDSFGIRAGPQQIGKTIASKGCPSLRRRTRLACLPFYVVGRPTRASPPSGANKLLSRLGGLDDLVRRHFCRARAQLYCTIRLRHGDRLYLHPRRALLPNAELFGHHRAGSQPSSPYAASTGTGAPHATRHLRSLRYSRLTPKLFGGR